MGGIKRSAWMMGMVILIFQLLSFHAFGSEPMQLIRSSVDRVLEIMRDPALKGPEKAEQRDKMIWEVINHRFNFKAMSQRTLAIHWRKRTPEEKKEFIELFSFLLQRSYVSKIQGFADQTIQYLGESIDGNYSVVKTKIITKGRTEIPIDYRLKKEKNGWYVYDVVIEGVSLINNYRTQFNRIIRKSSYKDLIKRMRTKKKEELFEMSHSTRR